MSETVEAWSHLDSEELLASVVGQVREQEHTDVALLEFLEQHILVLTPVKDAVDRALKDIEALAAKRGEVLDAATDHS